MFPAQHHELGGDQYVLFDSGNGDEDIEKLVPSSQAWEEKDSVNLKFCSLVKWVFVTMIGVTHGLEEIFDGKLMTVPILVEKTVLFV